MKLNIISSKAFAYPGQTNAQERFYEISVGSNVIEVDVNSEIGNSIPSRVWNNLSIRIHIPNNYKRNDIKKFYSKNRKLFNEVVSGYSYIWNGSNYVGKLTEKAKAALEEIRFDLECN